MNFNLLNLTPHDINIKLPDGHTLSYPPSGQVARVYMTEKPADGFFTVPVITRKAEGITGMPVDLPEGYQGVLVSSMVLDGLKKSEVVFYEYRIFAPDTGDTAIRDPYNHVQAVTRLVEYI